MTGLQIFNNSQFGTIRTLMIDDEPWFVGKDVATALGYEKARNAISSHVDSDDKITRRIAGEPGSKGGNPNMTIINESGLYSLIFGSKLENAKSFKRWVTSEVLPSIRKNGSYITDKADPEDLRKKANELESVSTINDMAKIILPVLEQAGMKPAFQALALKQIYRRAGIDIPTPDLKAERELFDAMTIARKVGMYSLAGKPHEKAAAAIIRMIGVPDEEKELVQFERNGHIGTSYQYSGEVVKMVDSWLKEHNRPEIIEYRKSSDKVTNYKVKYDG